MRAQAVKIYMDKKYLDKRNKVRLCYSCSNFKLMEENIILSEMGGAEFAAYFNELSRAGQNAFAKEYQTEILALKNAEIFAFLCDEGYFNYLAALYETGSYKQKCKAFISYYGVERTVWRRPSLEEEKKVLAVAVKDLELLRFLREDTTFFWNENKMRLRRTVYENVSLEGLDYLLLWSVRNFVPVPRMLGTQMFARASAKVIRRYTTKIGVFTGDQGVNFPQICALYERKDLSEDTKVKLILAVINRFYVTPQTIAQMRKADILV